MDADIKYDLLEELRAEYSDCERCGLCNPTGRVRQHVVFGEGNPDADLMIIGEAPRQKEDLTGEPFRGRSGELLNKYLETFHIERDSVFLTDVVMCRPTEEDNPKKNRAPTKPEIAACAERLARVIDIVDPMVILLLGNTALKALTKSKKGISTVARKDNSRSHTLLEVVTQGTFGPVIRDGIATFHPTYLLRQDKDGYGSDIHMTYLAIQKAIKLIDLRRHLYYGEPMPYRGEDDE